jgi:hypothetical protein
MGALLIDMGVVPTGFRGEGGLREGITATQ